VDFRDVLSRRPSKSLRARAIEESVLWQIRETQSGIADASEWEQMDRICQVAAVQAMVERVGYDGKAQRISIRFRQPEIAAGEESWA
jgi:hypothetical protein